MSSRGRRRGWSRWGVELTRGGNLRRQGAHGEDLRRRDTAEAMGAERFGGGDVEPTRLTTCEVGALVSGLIFGAKKKITNHTIQT